MADRQDGAEGTAEGVNGQKRVRGGKKKEESCAGPQTNGEMF